MSSQRKFTFAISSPDEFLVLCYYGGESEDSEIGEVSITIWWVKCSGVTGGWGVGPPRVTPSMGWHPKEKKLLANLQRIVEKRGRKAKKGVGWHPGGGDTRVKAIVIVTAMSKKCRQVFQEKIEGWHPQLPPRVSPTLVTPLVKWRDICIAVPLSNYLGERGGLDTSIVEPLHSTPVRAVRSPQLCCAANSFCYCRQL